MVDISYDMEVGENCVCIFHGTVKAEKERDWRYIQEALAPDIGPCIRTEKSCTSVTEYVEIVTLQNIDCIICNSATGSYIYGYKCECVHTHRSIDSSGNQYSPAIQSSPLAL